MLVFCAVGKGLRKVDLKDENIVEIVAFAADSWSRVKDCALLIRRHLVLVDKPDES
jgi:hypothetical protein